MLVYYIASFILKSGILHATALADNLILQSLHKKGKLALSH